MKLHIEVHRDGTIGWHSFVCPATGANVPSTATEIFEDCRISKQRAVLKPPAIGSDVLHSEHAVRTNIQLAGSPSHLLICYALVSKEG